MKKISNDYNHYTKFSPNGVFEPHCYVCWSSGSNANYFDREMMKDLIAGLIWLWVEIKTLGYHWVDSNRDLH